MTLLDLSVDGSWMASAGLMSKMTAFSWFYETSVQPCKFFEWPSNCCLKHLFYNSYNWNKICLFDGTKTLQNCTYKLTVDPD
jgi:hypothetical protein